MPIKIRNKTEELIQKQKIKLSQIIKREDPDKFHSVRKKRLYKISRDNQNL